MGAPWILLAAFAPAVLGACGHAAGIGEVEVSAAVRGVRAADEAGAREDAQAGHYLGLAERELRRSVRQLRVGDGAGARGWARRAWADAEVARMLAIEAETRDAAQRTEDHAQAISRALDADERGRER